MICRLSHNGKNNRKSRPAAHIVITESLFVKNCRQMIKIFCLCSFLQTNNTCTKNVTAVPGVVTDFVTDFVVKIYVTLVIWCHILEKVVIHGRHRFGWFILGPYIIS